jgi:nucleoside-diphosphate-sugar epimerase
MQTVGIIGGAGFIGSYVTKQFLENGFRVKVSATDISKRKNTPTSPRCPMQSTWNSCP